MIGPSERRIVGRALPHESAVAHVTGRAIFTDDQPPPKGLLHLWPVLSPYAHAEILALDTAEAFRVEGVVAVLTASDIPGHNRVSHSEDAPLLPVREVLYHGQPVAWVAGKALAAARRGAARVKATYRPLPAVLSLDAAIREESFHFPPAAIRRGDPEKALAEADFVESGEVRIGPQDHFYLETQTAWAVPEEGGSILVYSSTQHPSETQEVVAEVLGLPFHQVTVKCLRMGGGFGGKESQASPFAAIAALAAMRTGRPCRLRLNRDQDMVITGKRHPFLARYRVGFDREGRLMALSARLYSDGGWSRDLSAPVLMRALLHIDNAYFIPHLEVTGRVAKTHKPSNTAFRGFGGPQGMLVIEDVIGRVARRLGLPPDVVRERNFYRGEGETNTTHYGQEVNDNRIERVWREAKEASRFDERRAEIERWNRTNLYKRRGIALTPVKFGISFTQTHMNQAGALVLLYRDGSAQVNHGGTEMGQGVHTKIKQIAAECLGIPLDRVRIMTTSTDKVPNTSPSSASATSDLNGQAVREACETLKARLAPVAARLLGHPADAGQGRAGRVAGPSNAGPIAGPGVDALASAAGQALVEELVFADGRVFLKGSPERSVSFAEVVNAAYESRISLSATGFYRTPDLHFDRTTGKGKPFHYFVFGAAVSEVEVDALTGECRLVRVDIVHDAGASLNPFIDRGQVEGGFIQGTGWLTSEELVWNDEGALLTHAPSTYKIPAITDVPECFNVHLLPRAAQPGVIFGSKAVGEPPFMLALSVREAIRDAIASFAADPSRAVVELPSPATAERILQAIERVRGAGGSSKDGGQQGDSYPEDSGHARPAGDAAV